MSSTEPSALPTLRNPFHPFTPPFKYDGEAYIWDSAGNIAFQVRGWGLLVNHYKGDERAKRQDEIGNLVAQLMNEHAIKEGM